MSAPTRAKRSFGRALWAQALFAGGGLALASSNPATFTLASTNPTSLALILAAGALAGLVLGALGKSLSRRSELALAVAAFAFVPVDMIALEADLAAAFTRALLILQVAKLLGPRERRDESTILLVALVHVAVAASSTVELSFMPALLGYVLSAGYALGVRELASSPAAPTPPAAPVTAGFRLAQAGLAFATLILATIAFIAMPRVGAKLLPSSGQAAQRVSGFTDSIQLDQSGKIRESQRVAFRALIVERGHLPAVPLWRGRVLDNYSSSQWTPSRISERIGRQFTSPSNVFETTLHHDLPDPPLTRASAILDLQLEPMNTLTIFAPGVVHVLEFKTAPPPILARDSLGTLSTFQTHPQEMAYRVTCTPDARIPANFGTTPDIDQRTRSRCLRLPPEVDRARIELATTRALASAGLRADSPPEAIGQALEDYLGRNFRYTLDSKHEEGAERVAEFLFRTREGHCEIFASALAVMLRSVGIPSRIVNGYKGGEYHAWSNSYTVKERHAHSWVEALTEGGWIALDATPAIDLEGEAPTGLAATLEDAREWLEIRWFRNVIAFDSGDQAGVAKWARGAAEHRLENLQSWTQAGHELLEQGGRRDLGILGGVLAVLLVLGTAGATVGPRALLNGIRRAFAGLVGRGAHARSGTSLELERLLRALEARGVSRRQGETVRELAERAERALGDPARGVVAIVPAYYEARFGGRELRPEEREAIARAAEAVEALARS